MTDTGRVYHNHCTGEALQTVQRHAGDEDIILFAGCFCPFVQRAWVTLEYLGIPYKVCRSSLDDLTHSLVCESSIVSPNHHIHNVVSSNDMNDPHRHLTDEVDPYKKPKELLDLSPKGLVPALRLNNYSPPRALNESTVIMDFLEELVSVSLFMPLHTEIFFHLASHPH